MRTSLNEVQEIEQHVFRLAAPEDAFLFDAKLILNPDLRKRVQLQQQTYELIKAYGRNELKAEINRVHERLFNDSRESGFVRKIMGFFKKH